MRNNNGAISDGPVLLAGLPDRRVLSERQQLCLDMAPVSEGIVVAIKARQTFGKALLQSRLVVPFGACLLKVGIPQLVIVVVPGRIEGAVLTQVGTCGAGTHQTIDGVAKFMQHQIG